MMNARTLGQRGFTLIELMIVITIAATLISIAIPNYRVAVRHSREAVLRQNLQTLRSLVQQYTLDKQAAPGSLDDIVAAGYLRELPKDITGSPASWQVEYCEELASPEQTTTGICDVRSGASEISTEGTPYNTW